MLETVTTRLFQGQNWWIFFFASCNDILWISNYVPSLSWLHRDIVLAKEHSHTTDT
jgi:hypothetical protein